MTTPACLPTLVSALALMLVIGVALPSAVMAADPLGTPARPDSGTYRDRDLRDRDFPARDFPARDVPARDAPTPAGPQGEPYRADYFVDYHVKPGGTTTDSNNFVEQGHPANNRESIGRRDIDTSLTRNPFEGELRRFRGQMSNWRR